MPENRYIRLCAGKNSMRLQGSMNIHKFHIFTCVESCKFWRGEDSQLMQAVIRLSELVWPLTATSNVATRVARVSHELAYKPVSLVWHCLIALKEASTDGSGHPLNRHVRPHRGEPDKAIAKPERGFVIL